MVNNLQGIPKDSQIFKFITSGKKGNCELCSKYVNKLEAHHVVYSPQITINLCHNCHHKVHFWPRRLNDKELKILLSKRFGLKTAREMIKNNMLNMRTYGMYIAPSRNLFVRTQKIINKQS